VRQRIGTLELRVLQDRMGAKPFYAGPPDHDLRCATSSRQISGVSSTRRARSQLKGRLHLVALPSTFSEGQSVQSES